MAAGVRGLGVKGLKPLRFLSGWAAAYDFAKGKGDGLLDQLRGRRGVRLDQFLEGLVAGTWPDEGGGDFLGVAEQGSGGGFVEKVRGRVVLDFRTVEYVEPIGQSGDFFS